MPTAIGTPERSRRSSSRSRSSPAVSCTAHHRRCVRARPEAPGTSDRSRALRRRLAEPLVLDLRRVEGTRVSGSRVRPVTLRPAAQAVRRAMTDLYATGFVDPDAWQGGRLPDTRNVSSRSGPGLGCVATSKRSRSVHRLAASTWYARGRRPWVCGSWSDRRPLVAVASVRFRAVAIADHVGLPDPPLGHLHASPGRRPVADRVVPGAEPRPVDRATCTRRSGRAAGSPGLASTGTILHPGHRERRATGRIAGPGARRLAAHRRREPVGKRGLDPRDPARLVRPDPGRRDAEDQRGVAARARRDGEDRRAAGGRSTSTATSSPGSTDSRTW